MYWSSWRKKAEYWTPINLPSNTLLLLKLGLLYPLMSIFKTGQIVWKTLNSIRILDLAPQWNTVLKTTQNSSADATLQSNQQQEHRAGTEKASDLIIWGTRGYCISSVSREDIPVVRISPSTYKLWFASEKICSWTKMLIWIHSSSFAETCITAINHTSLKLCAKASKGKKIRSDSRIIPSDFYESATRLGLFI